MSPQTTLTDLSAPQSTPPGNQWGCSDCHNRRGPIQTIGGKPKVRCMGLLKDARDGCPSWSDGKDLEHMLQYAPTHTEPAQ